MSLNNVMNVVGHHFYLTTECGMPTVVRRCQENCILIKILDSTSHTVFISHFPKKESLDQCSGNTNNFDLFN